MALIEAVTLIGHTTTSSPRPHILYSLQVTPTTGSQYIILRRYSDFVTLHKLLKDTYILPQKHQIANAVFPSVWVNDKLIAERKAGLGAYIDYVIKASEFQNNTALLGFLAPVAFTSAFTIEDEISPSMTSRQTTLPAVTTREPDTSNRPLIAAAYYPTWCAGNNPPDSLDFSKFDILFFAFVVPNSSSTIDWDDGSKEILRKLVYTARQSDAGTKIVLSIGGWGGSHWFSNASSNLSRRTKLVDALVEAVNSFDLDGVDIDWEYPNADGSGNPHSPADAANLLHVIKALRKTLGPSKIISAAVTQLPWLGEDGSPLRNVSEFAAHMTYVNIMNYDVFGASATPGPNAPLSNVCGTSTQPEATAQAALAQWTAAGMPASKLLLGLALYGYVSRSSAKKLTGSFMPESDSSQNGVVCPKRRAHSKPCPPRKEKGEGGEGDDGNGNDDSGDGDETGDGGGDKQVAGDLSAMWGEQIAFSQLLERGALKKKKDGTYTGANGYTMGWDDCSDTPFLYNVSKTTVVSYDDTWSLADKAKFARHSKMAGCFTWSLDQDDGLALQNVICKNLGKD